MTETPKPPTRAERRRAARELKRKLASSRAWTPERLRALTRAEVEALALLQFETIAELEPRAALPLRLEQVLGGRANTIEATADQADEYEWGVADALRCVEVWLAQVREGAKSDVLELPYPHRAVDPDAAPLGGSAEPVEQEPAP